MKRVIKRAVMSWCISRFALLTLACMLLTACEDDSGSSSLGSGHDFGDNDSNVVLAIGDSITEGNYNDVSYPAQLAGMIGKQVINAGIGGSQTSSGIGRIESLLIRYQPGFVVILYGTNDATLGADLNSSLANLRAMVQVCQRYQSIPILCTLTPQTGSRIIYQGRVDSLSQGIRTISKEENVVLADVAIAFVGREEVLISGDNLHPNDTGAYIIAETIAKVF